MRRFGESINGFASGWMAVRAQKTQGQDQIMSIKETGSSKVFVTNGRSDILSRYLEKELEIESSVLNTKYSNQDDRDLRLNTTIHLYIC